MIVSIMFAVCAVLYGWLIIADGKPATVLEIVLISLFIILSIIFEASDFQRKIYLKKLDYRLEHGLSKDELEEKLNKLKR